MTGHGAKIGRKTEAAIAALLSHRTIDEAAHSINIAPKTLLGWLRLPEFKAAYLQTRREVVDQATARMQQATGAAARRYLRISHKLQDGYAGHGMTPNAICVLMGRASVIAIPSPRSVPAEF